VCLQKSSSTEYSHQGGWLGRKKAKPEKKKLNLQQHCQHVAATHPDSENKTQLQLPPRWRGTHTKQGPYACAAWECWLSCIIGNELAVIDKLSCCFRQN
jgi:hypothetical protein